MVRERVVGLLEALHQGDLELGEWTRGVVRAANVAIGEGLGVSLWAARIATGEQLACVSEGPTGEAYGAGFHERAAHVTGMLAKVDVETLFPDHLRVAIASERAVAYRAAGGEGDEYVRVTFEAFHSIGATDAIGLTSRPTHEIGICLMVPQRAPRAPSRAELARLAEISLHVEAALRVRLRPEAVMGTVSPSGRVELSGELPKPTCEALGEEVRCIERVRGARRRADGESALDAWRALCAGYLSLVEHVDRAGRRSYLLCENVPRRRQVRGLTRDEAAASIQAARGLPNKAIAYSLGWSESVTARRLSRAGAKLGLTNTRALARVLAGLGVGEPSRAIDVSVLTPSERDVASLLAEGLSNEAIATRRGVSVRTVANQVAAVLRKTGADSRRAFLAWS